MSLYSKRSKTFFTLNSNASKKNSDFNNQVLSTTQIGPNIDGNENVTTKQFDSYTRLIKQRQNQANDHDESNWLLSYADMMTILFGFFVLLMSFSKLDVEQFEKARQETTEYFGGEYKIPYEKFKKELTSEIKSQKLDDQVHMQVDEKGVAITFRGALFFDLGSSELKAEAQKLLEKIVPVIRNQNSRFTIMIEGHTDDNPISDSRFPSNWELSAYRASNVLHFFEKSGFNKENLRAIGFGDIQPIVPNRGPNGEPIKENQSQNRRVVIRLVKTQL